MTFPSQLSYSVRIYQQVRLDLGDPCGQGRFINLDKRLVVHMDTKLHQAVCL